MARALGTFALFALGCSASSPAAQTNEAKRYESLVALEAWTGVERDADPFVVDPELAPACEAASFRVETDQAWLELDTARCSWITVQGAARYPVEVGQPLRLELSHFDLNAPAPAEAELRLRFASCDVWSKVITIPSAADVIVEELASPCALHAADSILFHVHNHGQNTYQLQDVSVLR